MTKSLAVLGAGALLVCMAGAANAQGTWNHGHRHHARHAIMRQKAAYARAVAQGHYRAAERAHLRARAIRHHIRTRHMMAH